ncbi:MAG: GNAT family N-acetyltransferase [Myxococcales bacterium]
MARVRLAESPKDRAACLRLRWTVFVEEQGVPPSLEKDAHDEPSAETLHALAEIDSARGEPVPAGAGRCIFLAPGVAKLQRMAVVDDARGKGVGAQLLAFLEEEARKRGARRFTLSAQLDARGFYERAGYRAVGEVFQDAGIAHIAMERDA